MKGILAVGDICVDLRVRARCRPATGADAMARIDRRPGGSVAACAAFARRAGAEPVRFIGRIGDDLEGAYLTRSLAQAGVEARLRVVAGAPTARVVSVIADKDRTMYSDPGALASAAAGDVTAADLGAMAYLHVSGYTLTRPGGARALAHWVRLASSRGVGVSLDPGPAAPDRVRSLMGQVTLLCAEAREARRLELEAWRAPVTVITAGRGPVRLLLGDREIRLKPPRLVLDDPTGAGDALRGGLLARLAAGAAPEAALRDALADLGSLVEDGRLSWTAQVPRPTC